MQPGSVVPMNHKGVAFFGDLCRRWLRGVLEAPLSGVGLELLRSFVGSRRFDVSFGNGRFFAAFGMQRGGVSGDGLPGIAVVEDALRNVQKSKGFWRVERFQLLPMERGGDACSGEAPHTVRGDNGLGLPVPIDVQEDFVLAVFFLDLERKAGTVRLDKGLGNRLGGFKNLLEIPLRLEGCNNMQTLSPGGFDKRMVTEAFEVLFKPHRQFCDLGKFEPLRWV